ncbi:MAG TPA: GNAT family N-acetyltransferase [Bacteroidia bacterium]|nr:GNAT family N-acetyltransferase [Bacteroidia bacterium]
MESHLLSASPSDLNYYTDRAYSEEQIGKELKNPENRCYLVYNKGEAVGFSNSYFNNEHPELNHKNITKLDRIYILQKYYDTGIGKQLFAFNVKISKEHKQQGMWLYVWTGNLRAIKFYEKQGFVIAGNYEFKISPNHKNPNYLMYLKY